MGLARAVSASRQTCLGPSQPHRGGPRRILSRLTHAGASSLLPASWADKRGQEAGPMKYLKVVGLGTLAAIAMSAVAVGSVQAAALPTVSIAVTKSSITVGGTLQSGAVNVVSTGTGVKEAGANLFL